MRFLDLFRHQGNDLGEGGQRSIVGCASWQHDAVLDPKAASQRPIALLFDGQQRHIAGTSNMASTGTQSLVTIRDGEKDGVVLHLLRQKLVSLTGSEKAAVCSARSLSGWFSLPGGVSGI